MNFIKQFLIFAIFAATSVIANADANPDVWPFLKERMFKNKVINEVDFLKIDGPKRASSGAQVPVNIKITKQPNVEIKKLILIIDSNPDQKAATYHLTRKTQELDLSTRIRMETDSFVRVVGEDSEGKLYMSKVAIRASGGCSGYMNSQDPKLTKDLGKILVKAKKDYLTTRIKHPNFNGLQKDSINGWFVPEWIVTQVRYDFNGESLLVAENGISMSQDPYLKFNFSPDETGTVTVSATDTKGSIWLKTKSI
ncbi:quinoprotein dehydrogenase-associated SoxYZ-like carrier [Nitrosomonadales bacterium]|nr:quinoprotein dehydrogenase-associated SoxYZ-like carrier [Nitrosomonadales bacterium]